MQIIQDLHDVFGYSEKVAEKSVNLWRKGKLSKEQLSAMNWLFTNPHADLTRCGPWPTLLNLKHELGENNDCS